MNQSMQCLIFLQIDALGPLGWENLQTQRDKAKAKQMYKVFNGLVPQRNTL